MGMIASHMPKDVGGGGLHFLQFARISEELGKSPIGLLVFNSQAPDAGNMELMYKHVTPEQRETLPPSAGRRRRAQLPSP